MGNDSVSLIEAARFTYNTGAAHLYLLPGFPLHNNKQLWSHPSNVCCDIVMVNTRYISYWANLAC